MAASSIIKFTLRGIGRSIVVHTDLIPVCYILNLPEGSANLLCFSVRFVQFIDSSGYFFVFILILILQLRVIFFWLDRVLAT